uniref:Ubiquitin-like protease family profile domain-containing protein n=2 Tax=Meloidogyne TaxID=189290 RepID=A0A6V7UEM5_MELEN|nr:unnamed protein product [Meloidogyne enterolobii]
MGRVMFYILFAIAKKFDCNIGNKEDWSMKVVENLPQQKNAIDCGVFTILFAKCLIERNGAILFTQTDIPYYRRKLFKFMINVYE